MLGYFVTSPLFGRWAIGFRARGLIALGVATGASPPSASGLMQTFLAMALSRVVVGVGEASYATLAPTVIDDLAKPASKNRWLAIFTWRSR